MTTTPPVSHKNGIEYVREHIGALVGALRSLGSPHPVRHWLLALMVTGVIIAGSLVWNVFLFLSLAQTDLLPAISSEAPITLEEVLERAVTVLQERALVEETYRLRYEFVDPAR